MSADLCSCCDVLSVRGSDLYCSECMTHLGRDWFCALAVGCPVYEAYARCEPYPWEVAA